jgi:uncharacterized protein YegP (UPF0339 family)
MKTEYYTSRGRWYWRLRNSAGVIVSRSEQGFASKGDAVKALIIFLDACISQYDFLVVGVTA